MDRTRVTCWDPLEELRASPDLGERDRRPPDSTDPELPQNPMSSLTWEERLVGLPCTLEQAARENRGRHMPSP